jgi:hypothetical protein
MDQYDRAFSDAIDDIWEAIDKIKERLTKLENIQ